MENAKKVIYNCINNILTRENKEFAKLSEIYNEVSHYLEVDNDKILQSQIRGRLQENCTQYKSFCGEDLFYTEKIRSGNWSIKKNSTKVNKYKFIRYIKNTYLITDDNWETVTQTLRIEDKYNQEDNQDLIYKAKLVYEIGSEKANIIIQELNYIRDLLLKMKNRNKINDGYGTAFEVFSISAIHNLDYKECINKYIINGDKDGKIDSIYYADNDNVYIYQIKTNDFDSEDYDKMKTNYEDCLRNKIPDNGKDLFDFVKKNKYLLLGKKVYYKSVSNKTKKDVNYKPIDIYKKFFENRLLPENSNNIVLSILKPTRKINSKTEDNFSTDGNNNFNFYMSARELINYLLTALGIDPKDYDKETVDISKYFFDNVRGVLTVNKKMINTIENEPYNFVKYNNGINITGEVKYLGPEIVIKNPVINNGQQTITTLIRLGKNLDQIILSVKITNESNRIIKGKISQFSNDQVKVKAIDMLSLNPYIRNIQREILNREYNNEKYFLEIYSSGKKSYVSIIKKLYKKHNIINLLDFIKLYFSIENSKDLGSWKNNPNNQIDKISIDKDFDIEQSFKVCESIMKYNDFIKGITNKKEKDDYKCADLAFKYLLCKEKLSVEEASILINMINREYFYSKKDDKSKLIDIYKSSSIINKVEDQLRIYRNKKQLSTKNNKCNV